MKLTVDGQITIPENIRQQASLSPGSELEIRYENGRLCLEKVHADSESKWQKILQAKRQVEGEVG